MSETNQTLPASPRLIVIVPTYNRWKEARVSLDYLLKSDYQNFQVVLVEDACTDGTPEKCRAEFPDVHILHGNGDLWWSGAINMGLDYALKAGADAVVWLNDDNRVEPTMLSRLVESFGRQGARSIVCARVRLAGGDETEWVGQPPTWHRDFKTWRTPDLTATPDLPIEHPPGGQGVLIPAQCFREVGLVDQRAFPHYWADHDFHYRAMKAGYKYYMATGAVVWNQPNKERREAKEMFSSLRGVWWFLFNRRSPMNMLTVRRLLARHLPPREYRAIFYPILGRHLAWLAYGWLTKKPLLHQPLRAAKKSLFPKRAPGASVR